MWKRQSQISASAVMWSEEMPALHGKQAPQHQHIQTTDQAATASADLWLPGA